MSICTSNRLSVRPSLLSSFLFFLFNKLKTIVRIEIDRKDKKLEAILVLEERKKALVEININRTNSWAVIKLKKLNT